MKRIFWSLGISLVGMANLASAADLPQAAPAASLGLPRVSATLGLPQPSKDRGALLPAEAILQPVVRGQSETLPTPYRLIDTPQTMPRIDQPAATMKDAPAVVSTPPAAPIPQYPAIDCEEPLFNAPFGSAPFTADQCRFRVSAEYLMWWMQGFQVPPLVTTSPQSSNGILGNPGTTLLLGNQSLDPDMRSGMRSGFVWNFGRCDRWAWDGNFFFLGDTGNQRVFTSSGDPLLARPFFNLNEQRPFSELVTLNNQGNVLQGGLVINSSSSIWGFDTNMRRRISNWEHARLDFLVGYRYMYLDESLSIDERSIGTTSTGGTVNLFASDRFRTANSFNGAQIGLAFECNRGRWVLDIRTKLAMGVTNQSIDIDGQQIQYNANGTTSTFTGGLLALNSNIGHHTKNEFGIVPEVTFNIGYNLTDRCRIFVGYNLLYWNNIVRPGDQIDTSLDINRIPNFRTSSNQVLTPRPTVPWYDRELWVQGLNFGLQLQW